MKRLLTIFVVLMITLSISCSDYYRTEYNVRIDNGYTEDLSDISIGGASFGYISRGSVTSYKTIGVGSHRISGTSVSGDNISGSMSVQGLGTHSWTVYIDSYGNPVVSED